VFFAHACLPLYHNFDSHHGSYWHHDSASSESRHHSEVKRVPVDESIRSKLSRWSRTVGISCGNFRSKRCSLWEIHSWYAVVPLISRSCPTSCRAGLLQRLARSCTRFAVFAHFGCHPNAWCMRMRCAQQFYRFLLAEMARQDRCCSANACTASGLASKRGATLHSTPERQLDSMRWREPFPAVPYRLAL
jgi:hypothetical protein